MLILVRKIGEAIVIGDNAVNIRVLSRRGDCIKFGIEANKEISVHREEIYHRIKASNQELLDKKEHKDEKDETQ